MLDCYNRLDSQFPTYRFSDQRTPSFERQLVQHLTLLVGGDSHQVGEEDDQLGELHCMD